LRSPREVLKAYTSDELSELQALEMIDPSGRERMDLGIGIVASTIANAFKAKGQQTFKPKDFMPEFFKYTKRMSVEAMKKSLNLFFRTLGKKFGITKVKPDGNNRESSR